MDKLYKTVYLIVAINIFSAILGKLFGALKLEWLVYVFVAILGITFLCLLADYVYGLVKYKKVDNVFFIFSTVLLLSTDAGYMNRVFSLPYDIRLALLISNIAICVGLTLYSYLHYRKEGKNANDKTVLPFVQNSREDFLIFLYICNIAILSGIL